MRAWANSGGIFDLPALETRFAELEQKMSAPDFWDRASLARAVSSDRAVVGQKIDTFRKLEARLNDFDVLLEFAAEDSDPSMRVEARDEFPKLTRAIADFEILTLMSGGLDNSNAFLTVHAGAGGTEACDWADMLVRMYQRWGQQQGFKVEMIDVQEGEEVGLRGATLRFEGENAYGYLNCERGVHRLVRISPFDSQARRHTSFASIDATPDLEEEPELEIDEKDLEITTMRSGGKGGQNVNKVETGVLMRHLPSGVMVRCTIERSQHKNRDLALKILKGKLLQIEEDKKRSEMERVYGEKGEIGFGSQIRSYVFQPYQMVKDHRTGCETSNIQHVMDGDLSPFIEAKLRGHVAGESRDEV
jgi:peptide chain release factor 2